MSDDRLVVRGGTMPEHNLVGNIEDVATAYHRLGICVMVADDLKQVRTTTLVPHAKVCLSTPALLAEHGITLGLEATHDRDNPYQYTLWLPDEPLVRLTRLLWSAFRGPFQKVDLPDEWTTDDLRGLQRPGY